MGVMKSVRMAFYLESLKYSNLGLGQDGVGTMGNELAVQVCGSEFRSPAST